MKISILSPNLSRNCLGRAYLLAEILQKHYQVEIVGPTLGSGIWEPLRDGSIEYKSTSRRKIPLFSLQIMNLLKKITGDVIYVSKPLFSSYEVGILKKWMSKRALVLDIDDWELGLILDDRACHSANSANKVRLFLGDLKSSLLRPDSSCWWTTLNEKFVKYADQITVSNNFLKKKFGGTIIWHARDTTHFDPDKFDKNLIRKKYGIAQDEKAIIFCGTPRPYKGIEDLLIALRQIPEVMLIIVGIDERPYCRDIIAKAEKELGSKRIRFFGFQPFEKIPQFLAMSDIVAIPQRKSSHTIGQVPAKVFDAMAMAKPIIASKVSDLPGILSDCGWLVEPGQPDELSQAIRYVLDHPEEAEINGRKARERCENKYSYEAMEKTLLDVFKRYEYQ